MGARHDIDSGSPTRKALHQVALLGRALRLVWQGAPGLTMAIGLLVVLQGMLPLLSLYLLKLLVDAAANGLTASDRLHSVRQVAVLAGLVGGVALLMTAARNLSNLVSEAQSLVITDRVQEAIHAKSVEADLEYYENAQYYDTLHRAQQEAPYRPTRILNGLLQVGQSGLSLLAIVGLVISLHWGVALILLCSALPTVLLRLHFARGLYRWHRERTATERRAWYYNWLLTRDEHAKEVRLFDLGGLFQQRYRRLRQTLRRERLRLSCKRSLADLAAQGLATLGVFGSFVFLAQRAVQGVGTLGDLVLYYQAFQRGQDFLRAALSGLASLYEDSLFLSSLYEFLELGRKVVEPQHPRPVPRPMQEGLRLERVSFRYPGSTRNALTDITLAIRPGEVIALVGENGSGKTTLVKLLCRLYDPTEGTITLDGLDLRSFTTAALRREISVIFQDYARYNLTAADNIWFGNVSLPPDSARIMSAAKHAGADEMIQRLPQGYETVLGKWFEEGEELSVGEWQKLALARAFLRDAQLIVLDEPTSAMDAKTEYEVFCRFRALVAGRAAILISHRFSTVRIADTIYVLEDGRIIESGSHDELLRRGGTYARLFNLQAQHYR